MRTDSRAYYTPNQDASKYYYGRYLEGSFTPTVIGSGTPGAPTTVARQLAKWVRIENLVVCNYHIQFLGHTGSGELLIELPWEAANADMGEWNVQNMPIGWGQAAYDASSIYIIDSVARFRLAGYFPFIMAQDITGAGGFNIQGQFSYFTGEAWPT